MPRIKDLYAQLEPYTKEYRRYHNKLSKKDMDFLEETDQALKKRESLPQEIRKKRNKLLNSIYTLKKVEKAVAKKLRCEIGVWERILHR